MGRSPGAPGRRGRAASGGRRERGPGRAEARPRDVRSRSRGSRVRAHGDTLGGRPGRASLGRVGQGRRPHPDDPVAGRQGRAGRDSGERQDGGQVRGPCAGRRPGPGGLARGGSGRGRRVERHDRRLRGGRHCEGRARAGRGHGHARTDRRDLVGWRERDHPPRCRQGRLVASPRDPRHGRARGMEAGGLEAAQDRRRHARGRGFNCRRCGRGVERRARRQDCPVGMVRRARVGARDRCGPRVHRAGGRGRGHARRVGRARGHGRGERRYRGAADEPRGRGPRPGPGRCRHLPGSARDRGGRRGRRRVPGGAGRERIAPGRAARLVRGRRQGQALRPAHDRCRAGGRPRARGIGPARAVYPGRRGRDGRRTRSAGGRERE